MKYIKRKQDNYVTNLSKQLAYLPMNQNKNVKKQKQE